VGIGVFEQSMDSYLAPRFDNSFAFVPGAAQLEKLKVGRFVQPCTLVGSVFESHCPLQVVHGIKTFLPAEIRFFA
jgi:hypothetical protein